MQYKFIIFKKVGDKMPKVTIIEPDITPEENEENLKRIIKVLESIAQKLSQG